jgi:hypothetical protein
MKHRQKKELLKKLATIEDFRVHTGHKHRSVLNILDKEKKIVIGHRFIGDDKKSEIPAFKEELENHELFCDEGQVFYPQGAPRPLMP